MYIKVHDGVPHSVYGPVEDLVHDWRFQWHQRRSPSHHRHAFMHQPDFDQTVQFRGGELQGACETSQMGLFRGLG